MYWKAILCLKTSAKTGQTFEAAEVVRRTKNWMPPRHSFTRVFSMVGQEGKNVTPSNGSSLILRPLGQPAKHSTNPSEETGLKQDMDA